MALIAFVNVLSRYFINFSIGATEEITINLFVWMTVVGTGIAFERGAQLGMVTFFNLFPLKMRKSPGGFQRPSGCRALHSGLRLYDSGHLR